MRLIGINEELVITEAFLKVHFNSQSEIYLASHYVYHEKTNHKDIFLQFIRDKNLEEIVVERFL